MSDESLPATKSDLAAVRADVDALRAELKGDISRIATVLVKLDAKFDARVEREDAKMAVFRSEMLAAVEGAVVESGRRRKS